MPHQDDVVLLFAAELIRLGPPNQVAVDDAGLHVRRVHQRVILGQGRSPSNLRLSSPCLACQAWPSMPSPMAPTAVAPRSPPISAARQGPSTPCATSAP